MAVSPGSRLGPYEITSPLGAGGMGEVYRARDTRLGRDVAVKILPAEFAQNAQVKTRFEREARMISALNHPHICTLYDVGSEDGTDFIVMELIEGESLSDRLARTGALPIEEVLRYGIEIAEALDKAHSSGVVHRDLKPGNVMLTRSGAKLLDFGLAKSAVVPVSPDGATMQKGLTQEGTIVGTFQYMSPEQLESQDVDHRTDVFAFGALLYEMTTGRRAFEGKTRTSLIAAIVASQPPPLSQVQPLSPPALEHVIQRCLEKDPADRWQSTHDIAAELKWIRAKGSQAGVAAPVLSRRKSRERVAWTAALIAATLAIILGVLLTLRILEPKPRVLSSINPPQGASFNFESSTAVLSPDALKLAFVVTGSDSKSFLWVRQLSGASLLLSGTEGASFPFWSPDSRYLAFFADGKLKKIEAAGGPAETIAEALAGRGGSWNGKDQIVFAPSTGDPLYLVSASGGDVRQVTKMPTKGEEGSHRFPAFLPDGKHFIYFAQAAGGGKSLIGSTESDVVKPLLLSEWNVVYLPPGYLLFARDRILRAQRFNARKLALEGDAVTIVENIQTSDTVNFMNVSAAANGTLSYVAGASATMSRIVWLDRSGKEVDAVPLVGEYFDPRVSADGKRIALAQNVSGVMNLHLYDIARRVVSRFTFSKSREWGPVWSPDSQWIAYTSFENSAGDIHMKRATSTEGAQALIHDARRKVASDWSADGKLLFYQANVPKNGWDIEIYSFAEKRSRPFLQTPFHEFGAQLSPDGRWVAFVSNVSGRSEVYVQSFSGEGKWQISTSGGGMPQWTPDGRELLFFTPDEKLMSAAVVPGDTFTVDIPKPLFSARLRVFGGMTRNQYDIMPEGKVIVGNFTAQGQSEHVAVTLLQNWKAK